MRYTGRATPGRRGASRALFALLLLTLLLTAVMAYQAQEAARSHRATAEGALRDFAALAAWEFARQASGMVYGPLTYALQVIHDHGIDATAPVPEAAEFARRGGASSCGCGTPLDSVRYYFRVDLRTATLRTSDSIPAATRAWVTDTVVAIVASRPSLANLLVAVVGDGGGDPHMVAFTVDGTSTRPATAAYGFGVSLATLTPQFERAAAVPLVPTSLSGGVPNEELLTVAVVDAGGRLVFRSGAAGVDDFVAEETLSRSEFDEFTGLTVRAAIRPEAAATLVIGGLPRSRLPVLIGLLLLASALVLVAFVQLRRESELARLRSEFVSGVSHELRTPLAQIRMFAEMLRLGRVRSAEERKRSVEIIDQEARRLGHLVENVLRFSRAERETDRLAPEPTELGPFVEDVVGTFRPLARARQTRIEVAAGAVAVRVDRDALRQVLLNLLDNAVKYGPAAQTVRVTVGFIDGWARIAVEDEGPGVDPRDGDVVFRPFVRLNRAAEAPVGGSGIGLAVVRQLVELHGGTTRVETGRVGARLVVDLPNAHRVEGDSPEPGQDRRPDTRNRRPAAGAPSMIAG